MRGLLLRKTMVERKVRQGHRRSLDQEGRTNLTGAGAQIYPFYAVFTARQRSLSGRRIAVSASTWAEYAAWTMAPLPLEPNVIIGR